MLPARPALTRQKSVRVPPIELPAPTPIIEEELLLPVIEEELLLPVIEEKQIEPVKKKRVQSEKQKAAFVLLQEKRKEQVEKQKLIKK